MTIQPVPAAFRPAQRLADIGVSSILRIGAAAAALHREGRPITEPGASQPDFDTPDHVKEAAIQAIRDGQTKYTALDGSPELKAAVQHKFRRENGLDYGLDEITAGTGAKQVIYNALMASLDPGDEVIIPAPFWVSYADMVAICGGKPVVVPCSEEDGFRLTAEALERAITPKSRWLMLNAPSNPSGAAYSAEHYRPILDVVLRHPRLWLLADDIYEHILYDGLAFATPAGVEPGLKERTLTVNGVSKAYAMTGWRIGFAGGPKALIKAMATVQSQSTSCPSSVSQAAAIAALLGPQEVVRERCRSFEERRNLVVDRLNALPGIRCRKPEGAFYTFASCAGVIGRRSPSGRELRTDVDFCEFLLHEHSLAAVPGSAFGLAPFFRISYATSPVQLLEAGERMAAACHSLA
jgi:aspartate aminotransferase